ncbi:MAG: YcbK family protein [Hyphomicrobiales bacterium]|nr:YcbK family protein [Hyphomicrobiales bacterium]
MNTPPTRRKFLKTGLLTMAGAAGTLILPGQASAGWSLAPEKSLTLHNLHTGEKLKKIPYWSWGRYLEDSVREISLLMRDHYNNKAIHMDTELLDLLYAMQRRLGENKPIEVLSAYRSPETNRNLRKHSNGVAKNSLHMYGKAIDIRIPGYSIQNLRKVAMSLKAGGVGYYPRSKFVHLDTGPVRTW